MIPGHLFYRILFLFIALITVWHVLPGLFICETAALDKLLEPAISQANFFCYVDNSVLMDAFNFLSLVFNSRLMNTKISSILRQLDDLAGLDFSKIKGYKVTVRISESFDKTFHFIASARGKFNREKLEKFILDQFEKPPVSKQIGKFKTLEINAGTYLSFLDDENITLAGPEALMELSETGNVPERDSMKEILEKYASPPSGILAVIVPPPMVMKMLPVAVLDDLGELEEVITAIEGLAVLANEEKLSVTMFFDDENRAKQIFPVLESARLVARTYLSNELKDYQEKIEKATAFREKINPDFLGPLLLGSFVLDRLDSFRVKRESRAIAVEWLRSDMPLRMKPSSLVYVFGGLLVYLGNKYTCETRLEEGTESENLEGAAACEANRRGLEAAFESYKNKNGKYPDNFDISVLVKEGMFEKEPVCPSGGKYITIEKEGSLRVECTSHMKK